MKRPSKIAICIGIVVVIVGVWHLSPANDDKPADEIAANTPETPESAGTPADETDRVIAGGSAGDRETDSATVGGSEDEERSFTPRRPDRPGPYERPSALAGADDAGSSAAAPGNTARLRSANRSFPGPASNSVVDRPGPTNRAMRISIALLNDNASSTTRPAVATSTRPSTVERRVVMSPSPTGRIAPLRPTPARRPDKTHMIQAGDTFSALAQHYLGDAKYANLIARANPAMSPRRLLIGAKVKIPPAPVVASTTRPAGSPSDGPVRLVSAGSRSRFGPAPVIPENRAYTVRAGEGWYKLAKRFLGSGNRWTELYELNKERVPLDPKRLPVGAVIELPIGPVIATN